ncbi:MAG: alpha/beta hydrolase [Spirochaetes bacterium]|nr:alpha/beta hydrolase [Spirochaetota bacterium]
MKDTIIMIHGMWLSSWAWDNYVKFFTKKGYRCLTPILRYHDVDPKAPPIPELGCVSILDYINDLEKDLKAYKLKQPPIIIGHSMGAILAQVLLTRIKAKAFVLITPVPPWGMHMYTPSTIRIFIGDLFKWKSWRRPFKHSYNNVVYSMTKLLSPAKQKKYYNKMLYDSGKAGFEIFLYMFDSKKAIYVDKTKIKCPGLVIGAKQDKLIPVSIARKVAKKYRSIAEYKEYPDHAHWIIDEPGWEKVADDIYTWLQRAINKKKR